jgi:nucleoside 2-deoxyribosyltransferase
MKIIYIAAPYTKPDPVWNTHKAVQIAEKVYDAGFIPFIPHLTLLWHIINPKPEKFWYEYDLHILKRCDGLLRVDGYSVGADGEVEFCKENNIPVFYAIEEIIEYFKIKENLEDK